MTYVPIAVNVRGAEGERVVDESGIDHRPPLSAVQEVRQVAEVPVASSDSVPGAVLVQHENLARGKPALSKCHNRERSFQGDPFVLSYQ